MPLARCGLECEICEYREKMNCAGCHECNAKVFWGECPIALCSINKGLENCSTCEDFPCQKLKDFAYDPKQGDNGLRIENLKKTIE